MQGLVLLLGACALLSGRRKDRPFSLSSSHLDIRCIKGIYPRYWCYVLVTGIRQEPCIVFILETEFRCALFFFKFKPTSLVSQDILFSVLFIW